MKIRMYVIAFAWWVVSGIPTGQILAQSESPEPASPPAAISFQESFEKAFRRVIGASKNRYKDIVTDEEFKENKYDMSRYHKISVTFPGAVYAVHSVDYNFMDYSANHQIKVMFFDDEDTGKALAVFNGLKSVLEKCQAKQTGGQWRVSEKDGPSVTSYGRVIDYRLNSQDEDVPDVSLKYQYAGVGSAQVFLRFFDE